jgi:hypothetical protein
MKQHTFLTAARNRALLPANLNSCQCHILVALHVASSLRKQYARVAEDPAPRPALILQAALKTRPVELQPMWNTCAYPASADSRDTASHRVYYGSPIQKPSDETGVEKEKHSKR